MRSSGADRKPTTTYFLHVEEAGGSTLRRWGCIVRRSSSFSRHTPRRSRSGHPAKEHLARVVFELSWIELIRSGARVGAFSPTSYAARSPGARMGFTARSEAAPFFSAVRRS